MLSDVALILALIPLEPHGRPIQYRARKDARYWMVRVAGKAPVEVRQAGKR